MDVSMPLMGGMEATQKIRQFEGAHELIPTPIIALTAHASMCHNIYLVTTTDLILLLVIGDRERCLQAGMVSRLRRYRIHG